jgi:plasmid replication initiation protein
MRSHPRTFARRILCATLITASALSACDAPADSPAADTDSTVAVAPSTVVETTGVESVDSAILATARDAASALGQGLMRALLARLEAAGPDSALAFCADSAQALTARYQAAGIDVHRTSLRVRNPGNAPDSAEVRVLEYLAALKTAGTLPTEFVEVRRSADGTRELRYFRPVTVAAGCLACHGVRENIAPSIQAVLAQRYPTDSAVGYAEGDLRGVVAVRMDLTGR